MLHGRGRGQSKKLAALAYAIASQPDDDHANQAQKPTSAWASPLASVGTSNPEQADTAYLWPCNVVAWGHWQAVQTQWRIGGMGSPTGLDYVAVCIYLDAIGMKKSKRKHTFDGIRAAEAATLRAWGEKAKAKAIAEQDKRG